MSIGAANSGIRRDDGWGGTVWGRIDQARRELAAVLGRDVTDQQLADMVGLKQPSISGWRQGSRPSRESFEKLEQLFVSAGLVRFTARFLDYGPEPGDEHEAKVAADRPTQPGEHSPATKKKRA